MSFPERCTQVVLASANEGKLREIRSALPTSIKLVSLQQRQFQQAEETGLSYVENAIIKARHACQHTGLPAIADDSGLEVDALDGAPGIYSARYAGADADDAANNAMLLDRLRDVAASRAARFVCVLVFMRHAADSSPIICHGVWRGEITTEPRGSNGFGYDPLFLAGASGLTSAELEPEHKNRISHRGQALRAMHRELAGLFGE